MNEEKVTYTSLADFAAWELEAYADGVTIPHLARFLAEQPAQAAAWQRQQQAWSGLQSTLYRFDCPTLETLQDYHWRDLAPAEQETIEAHLQLCPHCRAELSELRAFLTPPRRATTAQPAVTEPATGWQGQIQAAVEHLRLVIANLVAPPSAQFAGVALRGESDLQSLLLEAEGVDISLLLQKEAAGTILLSGQLLSATPSIQNTVTLIPQAPALAPATTQTDAIGNFTFHQIRPGLYQLQIALADQLIIAPVLSLE